MEETVGAINGLAIMVAVIIVVVIIEGQIIRWCYQFSFLGETDSFLNV